MLFNFVFNTDTSQGQKDPDVVDIQIKTVEAGSIDDAIYTYILGDNLYERYIMNLLGHSANLWNTPDGGEDFAKELFNKFDEDSFGIERVDDEAVAKTYNQIIDENLKEIAELIKLLPPTSKFFKIEEIETILTNPRPKSAIKV